MTTVTHGKYEFEVRPLPDAKEHEAPYELVLLNKRSPACGKVFRLWRNKQQPNRCFPVAEDVMSVSNTFADLWFEITPEGVQALGTKSR